MEFKIEEIEDKLNGEILKNLGNGEYIIKLNNREQHLKVIDMDDKGIEFVLDQKYHKVKYLEITTAKMSLVVDGVPMTLTRYAHLDEIVYKNLGGEGAASAEQTLKSQIPGKVVSIAVQEGSEVKKGDTVCVLESMKMQVSVKSHRDGTVKSIKIKQGGSVAKNDVIAEIE